MNKATQYVILASLPVAALFLWLIYEIITYHGLAGGIRALALACVPGLIMGWTIFWLYKASEVKE